MDGHHKIKGFDHHKNINTPNNTNDQTPPSRLQLLITAAQSGDRQALLQLCEDFSPLLKARPTAKCFTGRWVKMPKVSPCWP